MRTSLELIIQDGTVFIRLWNVHRPWYRTLWKMMEEWAWTMVENTLEDDRSLSKQGERTNESSV